MATAAELSAENFTVSTVVPQTLNIDHADPFGRGPFCRLSVITTAPASPGVYAWVADDALKYIGEAGELLRIVHGARLGSPYNDYSYIPPSQARRPSDPRVRVNGLINAAIGASQVITWWWRLTDSEAAAKHLEAVLIDRWNPPWNRARPSVMRAF